MFQTPLPLTTHCNTLQHTAIHCNTERQGIPSPHPLVSYGSLLLCIFQVSFRKEATNYRVFWRKATCKDKPHFESSPSCTPQEHCNTLQYTATHCNTLQHTATHYESSPPCRMTQHKNGAHFFRVTLRTLATILGLFCGK